MHEERVTKVGREYEQQRERKVKVKDGERERKKGLYSMSLTRRRRKSVERQEFVVWRRREKKRTELSFDSTRVCLFCALFVDSICPSTWKGSRHNYVIGSPRYLSMNDARVSEVLSFSYSNLSRWHHRLDLGEHDLTGHERCVGFLGVQLTCAWSFAATGCLCLF